MSGLFSKPKMPPPPPPPPSPAPMPDAGDLLQKERRRKGIAAQQRTGRLSTMLSERGGDTLG